MRKFAGDRFESQIRRNAGNAVRGNKSLSGAFEPEGYFVLTVNGKKSPSIEYLQQSFGTREAWRYLTKDCCAAHDPRVGKFIAQEIDY